MSAEKNLFDTLPGQDISPGLVPEALSRIWETAPETGGQAPSEFRASQLNMIVHLGKDTESEEAAGLFATALRFSHRHPSRLIVLCPEDHSQDDRVMAAKIFAECHIGKTGRDRSCCEAVLLAYPAAGKDFLENQVSILLDNDLPTYYRIHRFNSARKLSDYGFFLKVARRVVFDSACEIPEVLTLKWPHPEAVRDLVFARLLPVRQSIGRFLSAFSPGELTRDLRAIELAYAGEFGAEACCLGIWLQERLACCVSGPASPPLPEIQYTRFGHEKDQNVSMDIRFDYPDGRYFRWTARKAFQFAEMKADYGMSPVRLTGSAQLLSPEAALAEAFFF